MSKTVPSVAMPDALRVVISWRTAGQYMAYLGRQDSDRVVKARKVAW